MAADQLTPIPDDDEAQDDYHGGTGWVIVASGLGGRACVVAIDPAFGALRWMVQESGLHDPDDELGLRPPDEGLYRGTFRAVESRCPETHYPDGLDFVQEGDWHELTAEEAHDLIASGKWGST